MNKLEIGGSRIGWLSLDYMRKKAHINLDLRLMQKIPLEDNSIVKVFSSHCIEHINNEANMFLFNELYRICKDGAILRFACPDADKFLMWYEQNALGQLAYEYQTMEERLINWFVSYECGSGVTSVDSDKVKENYKNMDKEEFLDWSLTHVDNSRTYIAHCNWFDFNKLSNMLKEAGFKNVVKSSAGGSKDYEMATGRFDIHQPISLYVECEK